MFCKSFLATLCLTAAAVMPLGWAGSATAESGAHRQPPPPPIHAPVPDAARDNDAS